MSLIAAVGPLKQHSRVALKPQNGHSRNALALSEPRNNCAPDSNAAAQESQDLTPAAGEQLSDELSSSNSARNRKKAYLQERASTDTQKHAAAAARS